MQKNMRHRVLALLLMLMLLLSVLPLNPTSARAEEDTSGEWPASYFTWEGDKVTGLNEEGLAYLRAHPHMVIASHNPDGQPVKTIGKMAFALLDMKKKAKLTGVKIPDSVTTIEAAAFFRNAISGKVTLPEGVTEIPASAFRGNAITEVEFQGAVTVIDRLAFAENQLTSVSIPETLATVGEQAFMTNPGAGEYGDHVVLWTPEKNNPRHLENKENYYVDPSDDLKTDAIDATTWTHDDFSYSGDTLIGFSASGKKKIKRNKHVVVPDNTPDGQPVKVLGTDAFRNLQTGYDIETIRLPDSIEVMEDYCLQFNPLENFTFPKETRRLGYGVVMMCGLKNIVLPEKLEYIDQIAFYGNTVNDLVIPPHVTHIGVAAFRDCGIRTLTIQGEHLKKIDRLAFAENQLKEVNIPASLKEIGHQAFTGNTGMPDYNNAVVLWTPERNNPQGLPDDEMGAYVVDPGAIADKTVLREAIKAAARVQSEGAGKHSADFWSYFEEALKAAKDTEVDNKASIGACASATKKLKWITNRAALDRAVVEAKALDLSGYEPASTQFLKDAIQKGEHDVMVLNISDRTVDIDETNLAQGKALLVKLGESFGYHILDGSDLVKVHPSSFWKNTYDAKVRVAVKKDDHTLQYILDNGTETHLRSDDEMEEHDYPYWRDALKATMGLFLLKDKAAIKDITPEDISDATKTNPDVRTSATLSGTAIQRAVLKAYDTMPKDAGGSSTGNEGSNSSSSKGHHKKKVSDKKTTDQPVEGTTSVISSGYLDGFPDGGIHPDAHLTRSELASILCRVMHLSKEKGDGTHWASADIETVKKAGLMRGYPDGSFGEDREITRAELVAVLLRAKQIEVPQDAHASADARGHWAEADLAVALEKGIIKGYPDGRLLPDMPVTRAEAVSMMNRTFHVEKASVDVSNPWNDISTDHWAYAEFMAARRR